MANKMTKVDRALRMAGKGLPRSTQFGCVDAGGYSDPKGQPLIFIEKEPKSVNHMSQSIWSTRKTVSEYRIKRARR